MGNNTNSFIMNNPMRKMKSIRLKRDKGSRYLIPKTRFSNNVEERYIPYNKDNNYKLTPITDLIYEFEYSTEVGFYYSLMFNIRIAKI